jgi:hypothetical protein
MLFCVTLIACGVFLALYWNSSALSGPKSLPAAAPVADRVSSSALTPLPGARLTDHRFVW